VVGTDVFIPSLSTHPFKVLRQTEGGFGRVFFIQSVSGEQYVIKTLKWDQSADRKELYREGLKLARIPAIRTLSELLALSGSTEIRT